MGQRFSFYFFPEVTPDDVTPLQFDPLIGFPEGARKKKEFKVTKAEIESVQVPDEFLDFCLHKNLEWKSCTADHFPFNWYCKPQLHAYHACMYEEYKDRMRDYERERRLMVRKQRRIEKEKKKQELSNNA